MVLVGTELVSRIQAGAQQGSSDLPGARVPGGCQCAVVAQVPELAGRLVRSAVPADRRAGAGWAQIGAGLGISAEGARSRFGRVRGSPSGACRGK
ncbi:hypothetical protein SAV14893_092130 [Streptomyces avermitilis]|uniref:Uncharacterized protein n=1 Tax=Streptomyces avermitilis TaxID=33903 RepID=A0A4D4NAA1_STRAX|nr:hypothetical protein SAVMC3_04340 [Streptomyces avermitilis]GDY69820.1 hypothetical protein SAV14893_092130 [Streptomyces avermitilis]GDY80087.1 hypothetical protein SAV31267_095720 [Streptomyces avermitilis]